MDHHNFGASAFTVKAYLGETNPEIRRFTLDQDVATNFVYLREKIAVMFPTLANSPFRVYWRDPEGDHVVVSSDEELMEAITHGVQDGLLRLYLRDINQQDQEPPVHPSQASDSTQNKPVHPGVTCDGCDEQVIGVRFKCLVCPDFDLCEVCCGKGFHSHHYMLRMSAPATEFHHGGPGPQGCRRGQQGRHGWWGPVGEHAGRNWRRFWKNMMRYQPGFMGEPAEAQPQEGASASASQPSQSQEGASTSQPKPPSAESQEEQRRDYLNHVGEQVATMLEPLGVKVDFSVESHPNDQQNGACGSTNPRCTRRGKSCFTEPQKYSSAPTEQPAGIPARSDCIFGRTCKPDENCKENCAGARPKVPAAETTTAPMEQDPDELSWIKVDSKDQDMDVLIVEKKPETKQSSASALAEPIPSTSSADPQGAAAAPSPIVYPPVTSSSLYPSLAASAPVYAGPPSVSTELEKRVSEAVEQMKAMGFHDERGWMTAMLYQHDGDVHKVIDTVLRQAQENKQ